LQELDHVSIMKPITKFAATVPHTQRIPEIISMAFREAYNGRPGPSFLEIPRDVLDTKVDLDKCAKKSTTSSLRTPFLLVMVATS